MAQNRQDLLSKLAERGEDVVGRITDMPRAQRLLEAAGSLRERVDELERRVAALERKVDQLAGGTSTRRTTAKRTTTKRSTRAKPSTGGRKT